MLRKTKIWIAFGVLTFFGLGLVALGVAVPYIVQDLINDGLDELYLKSSDSDSWGVVPGDIGVKLTRCFALYNVTNPEEIFQGGKPKLVEMPLAPYQEISKYTYWSYVDDDGKEVGQDDEQDLLAYNYELSLKKLENNKPRVPDNQMITIFSLDRYALFYGLSHQVEPFYGHQNLHDVVLTFENDMYDGVAAYSIFYSNLTDQAAVSALIQQQGFTADQANTILNDPTYGWGSWQGLKYWIQALQYYTLTQNSENGIWDRLNNYFQISDLYKLVESGSFLNQCFEDVKADMVARYGTDDRVKLGHLQWSNATIISDMPFGVASPLYEVPGVGLKIPSYLGMNQTFNFIPEIYLAAILLKVEQTDFTDITDTLLEVDDTYPMTNSKSMLNLDTVVKYFTFLLEKDYVSAMSLLDLNSPQQAQALAYYIVFLGALPITLKDGTTKTSDGYSLLISRWARRALVNNYISLYDDAFYVTHSATLFCSYVQANIDCKDVIERNVEDATVAESICTSGAGWNISSNSWENLALWSKAALKTQNSDEFAKLLNLTGTTSDDLSKILYTDSTGIRSDLLSIASEISSHYSCSHTICTYDELYYLQWGSSGVTVNPPASLAKCFSSARSMKEWVPGHYSTYPEWYASSDIPLNPAASKNFISYNGFLNPTPLRMFLNSYYKGDMAQTAATFGFPNEVVVGYFYNYLLSSIPGFNFLPTLKYWEVMEGYYDELFSFVIKMTVLEGGVPTAFPNRAVNEVLSDKEGMPKHVINTGKSDNGDIKKYVKYYGHEVMDFYGPVICVSCENGFTFGYTNIWDGNLTISGTDGGAFGPDVDSEDKLEVYVNTILRYVRLRFSKEKSYEGVTVKKFVIDDNALLTSDKDIFNANFNQYPHGYDGFMNLTTIFNAPVFLGQPHFLGSDEKAQTMAEFYEYTTESSEYLTKRIHPNYKHDDAYLYVEPTTGAAVSIMLKLQINVAVYQDYFFTSIYEPVEGKGLYVPAITVVRSFNMTNDQIEDNFGNLMTAWKVQEYSLPAGLGLGGFFLLISMILLAWQYRIRRAEIRATMLALLAEKYRSEQQE